MSRPAGLWEMVKLPMDLQRTKESSDGCQRSSSSSQVDVFKAFSPAMAGERHDGAARVGIFGGAVQVVATRPSPAPARGWHADAQRRQHLSRFARRSQSRAAAETKGHEGTRRDTKGHQGTLAKHERETDSCRHEQI